MKATELIPTQVDALRPPRQASGQAMVEYIIIATLVILALVAILSTVAPIVAGIFDNTIGAFDPDATVDPNRRDTVLTLVASYTPDSDSISTPDSASSFPSSPSSARRTSNPHSWSRIWRTSLMASSSSTTKILVLR